MRVAVRRASTVLLSLSMVAIGATSRADGPQCVTVFGRTACGYACATDHGDARCARTPEGVCASGAWRTVCWDPPPYVRFHFQGSPPQPECVIAGGEPVCGYHCVVSGSRARCAQTPMGACGVAGGRVVCGDPRPEEFRRPSGTLDAMHCETSGQQVACGYTCASAWGELRCAQSPDGTCSVESGRVACFDPPPPPAPPVASP